MAPVSISVNIDIHRIRRRRGTRRRSGDRGRPVRTGRSTCPGPTGASAGGPGGVRPADRIMAAPPPQPPPLLSRRIQPTARHTLRRGPGPLSAPGRGHRPPAAVRRPAGCRNPYGGTPQGCPGRRRRLLHAPTEGAGRAVRAGRGRGLGCVRPSAPASAARAGGLRRRRAARGRLPGTGALRRAARASAPATPRCRSPPSRPCTPGSPAPRGIRCASLLSARWARICTGC